MTDDQCLTEATQSYNDEKHLFLDCDGRRVGCACLDYSSRRLILVEDMLGNNSSGLVDTVEAMVTQLDPQKVVVCSRMDSSICTWIHEQSAQRNFTYDIVKTKMYSAVTAVRAIDDVLDTVYGDTQTKSSVYTLLSELKFSKELSMARSSFGALSQMLENLTIMEEISHTLSSYIKSAAIFTLSDHLYIDRDSYFALQLLKSPTDQAKSGVKSNVFDYIDKTGSPMGHQLLMSWFLSPLANIEKIKERQHTVKILLDQNNAKYLTELVQLQKQLGNIENTLTSIETAKPNVSHWIKLDSFLRCGIEMINTITSFTQLHSTSIGSKIVENTTTLHTFKEILLDVTSMIDFDASMEYKRVYIKDGVDSRLDEMRRKYTGLEQVLESLAHDLLQIHPEFEDEALNAVYIPQLGYLISLDLSTPGGVPDCWTEVFRTTTTTYYKDDYMMRMDDEDGDVYQLIVDYEIELLHLLQNKIVENGIDKVLLETGAVFAELDCYLSLATVAVLHDFVQPEIVEDQILFIEKGRNIILEQTVSSFVPNDTLIPEQTLSVITGANSSGKSVYLTQVGIIVFLAHIGSCVPASRATIGITDKLLTRIVTREAIDKCESTFFIDLQKMSKCIELRTSRSIILVDEFGKGTDTLGGPSLLGSIIEGLVQSPNTSRSIITTHFHELFKEGILKDVDRVKHSHMDVVFSKNRSSEITYLYQLKDGFCDNSLGIECAQVCGIPQSIITRAREIAVSRTQNKSVISELDQGQVQRAKVITKDFLLWDIEPEMGIDQVKSKLKKILATTAECS